MASANDPTGQFDAQAPYVPGTFWLVNGQTYLIDRTGRPVNTNTGVRPVIAWWDARGYPFQIQRLHLVPA